jgi:transcriptional regulator with PAS, ATPase and Fis domain
MQANELEAQLAQAAVMQTLLHTEPAVESAIMVYLAAKAEMDAYNHIADSAKKLIGDVMLETGVTAYTTKAGKVSMASASTVTSYDTKALDALIASSDEVRRLLEHHRKISERAGTMRIVGAK